MHRNIDRQAPVTPKEIEDLRAAVGWDRCEGTHGQILKRHFAYYTIRDEDGLLIAYTSVLSDGIADALLLDLVVHPDHQGKGLGKAIVSRAIQDIKDAGIHCFQVTFEERLEPFYAKCGFHILKGGVIDFRASEENSCP